MAAGRSCRGLHSNRMEASSVRQSKTKSKAGNGAGAVLAGIVPLTPENGKRRSDSGKLVSANASSASASVTSVSWPRGYVWSAAAAIVGGLILRLWMLRAFPQVNGDGLIYGTIARNLLEHGRFALTDGSGVIHDTLIRLPGYPIFLATCFRIFGVGNYTAVAYLQIVLEVVACLLLADFVRRIYSPLAGLITLWSAALCPFTAVYSSPPLTESLTFDMICLAMWSLERYLERRGTIRRRWLWVFTVAICFAALLRPDGALVAVALWPALIFERPADRQMPAALRAALLCGLVSVLPFTVWAARNWSTFHVLQPLAPRYATDPGEDTHPGWQQWVKTWCLDFSCTYEVYWNVPDGPLAMDALPSQAFDSAEQRAKTAALVAEYNVDQQVTPEMDARFGALARERAAAHPLRTYVVMPLGRLADMLLRPRVENLPIDLRWWEYSHHRPETRFSVAYGVVNLIYLLAGLAGFFYRPRLWPYMAAYLVLRSMLLLTVEAPETRYTLEFFPILFALGGVTFYRVFSRQRSTK